MKRRALIVLLSLVVTSDVYAQEEWHVTDSQNAADLFETDVRNISLSPDGTMLAGSGGDEICIVILTTGDEKCFSTAETFQASFAAATNQNPLVWSPDNTHLLFHENFYQYFMESDLWSLDVTNGRITNLTDDGVLGGILNLEDDEFTIDYLPAYTPNDDIYFFRSERLSSGYNITLQRLAVGADEPEQVVNLTLFLPTLSIFYSPVVSPDGTQIVFPVQAVERDDVRNGLWLVDLTTGQPRQLTDVDDTHVGLPESQRELFMYITNPVWAAGGEGIVFRTFNPEFSTTFPGGNYLYVDVATGEVSPVIDLSDFPPPEEAFLIDEEGYSQIIRVPRDGAMSADGSTFVYLRHDVDPTMAQIAAVPLPPDGSEPVVLGEVEYAPYPFAPNTVKRRR